MKSLLVQGHAILRVPFSTEVSMTEEEFDNLSDRYQTELISTHVNWNDVEIDSDDVINTQISETTIVDPKTGMPIED